jgi:hypothetical protein
LAIKCAEASSFTVALGKHAFYAQVDLEQPKAYAYAKEVMSMNSLAADAQGVFWPFLRSAPFAGPAVNLRRLAFPGAASVISQTRPRWDRSLGPTGRSTRLPSSKRLGL